MIAISQGRTALELRALGYSKFQIGQMILSEIKAPFVYQPERQALYREYIKLNFMDSGVNVPNRILKKIGYEKAG